MLPADVALLRRRVPRKTLRLYGSADISGTLAGYAMAKRRSRRPRRMLDAARNALTKLRHWPPIICYVAAKS